MAECLGVFYQVGFFCRVSSLSVNAGDGGVAVQCKDGTNQANDPSLLRVAAGELKFGVRDRFQRELRRRVQQYFQGTGRRHNPCLELSFPLFGSLTVLSTT